MRFVIAGAGAIGAWMGARMCRAGEDVTLFARGRHLEAMRRSGLRVVEAEDEYTVQPRVTGEVESIGPADVVFLAVKAHSLPALAARLGPRLGPDTAVVTMQNGIPWWYFEEPLASVDPEGIIASAIERGRVVGSIVYFSTEIVEPGVVRHIEGNRISVGEPDGTRSERCRAIAAALVAAGLRCPVTAHLRQEIWVKLLGNASFNPISALTGATLRQIVHHREAGALVHAMMTEIQSVAARLGMELPVSIEQRMAGAEKVGDHKTSMLQDLEAGRPLELEALVGAVLEIGERLAISMPHTRAVYACTRLLAQTRCTL